MGPVGKDAHLIAFFRDKWWDLSEDDKQRLRRAWRVDFSEKSVTIDVTKSVNTRKKKEVRK